MFVFLYFPLEFLFKARRNLEAMVSTRCSLEFHLSEVQVWPHLACSPSCWWVCPFGLMIYIGFLLNQRF